MFTSGQLAAVHTQTMADLEMALEYIEEELGRIAVTATEMQSAMDPEYAPPIQDLLDLYEYLHDLQPFYMNLNGTNITGTSRHVDEKEYQGPDKFIENASPYQKSQADQIRIYLNTQIPKIILRGNDGDDDAQLVRVGKQGWSPRNPDSVEGPNWIPLRMEKMNDTYFMQAYAKNQVPEIDPNKHFLFDWDSKARGDALGFRKEFHPAANDLTGPMTTAGLSDRLRMKWERMKGAGKGYVDGPWRGVLLWPHYIEDIPEIEYKGDYVKDKDLRGVTAMANLQTILEPRPDADADATSPRLD